jgi:mRNA interferase MazF
MTGDFSKQMNCRAPQQIKRGDIFYADLGDGIGSEQKFVRPVIVVQNDIGNKYSNIVTIIPITSQKKNNLPTHVALSEEKFLTANNIAIVEQIRTISMERLKSKIGEATMTTMRKIDIAVDIQAKQFDFDRAYELYVPYVNIKKAIKICGETKELLNIKKYLVQNFKDYCGKYNKDCKQVAEQLNKNYSTVHV